MDPKGYRNPRISEQGEPYRKVCITRPVRADSLERPATLKILLSNGAEKTVPFPPRPERRGFSETLMSKDKGGQKEIKKKPAKTTKEKKAEKKEKKENKGSIR